MTTFLKVVIAAVGLTAAASSLADASSYTSGVYQACQDHDYTPHGVWDCR
jgi:hypothetical protein